MRKRPVRATDLATMGKCENLARLKHHFEERAPEEVIRAARRGTEMHKRFEKEPVGDRRCFVASWALGPEHWATEELRLWRDRALLGNEQGRRAVEVYYRWSPRAIALARRLPGAKALCSAILEMIARKLRASRANGEAK